MCATNGTVCHSCGKAYPADAFQSPDTGKTSTSCASCRKEKKSVKRKAERSKTMHDIEAGAITAFTASAIAGGQNIPHSCEVLERVMEYFGGVSGFSSLLVKQYFDSPPGSSQRAKMLEAILRLVVKNTEQGGAKKPLGQWSDDELESELDARLRTIAVQYQGRIVDGTFAQEAEGATATAVGLTDERVPGGPAEGDPGRARRPKNRGAKAVQPDAEPGGDARLQGE
jgi:hypothetical protein